MNRIDIVQPTPKRACEHSDSLCTYCKLDWSSEDWDREKAKAREQKSLIDFMPPSKTLTTK